MQFYILKTICFHTAKEETAERTDGAGGHPHRDCSLCTEVVKIFIKP